MTHGHGSLGRSKVQHAQRLLGSRRTGSQRQEGNGWPIKTIRRLARDAVLIGEHLEGGRKRRARHVGKHRRQRAQADESAALGTGTLAMVMLGFGMIVDRPVLVHVDLRPTVPMTVVLVRMESAKAVIVIGQAMCGMLAVAEGESCRGGKDAERIKTGENARRP